MAASYITITGTVLSWLLLWQPGCCDSQTWICKQQQQSACVFECQMGGGSGSLWLDLSSLKPATDLQPVFKDVTDPQGQYMYSYSPCSAFIEGSGCVTGTSACQADILGNTTIDVGDSKSAYLSLDKSKQGVLTYSKVVGNATKTTQVTLVCNDTDQRNQLTVQGEDPAKLGTYKMKLTGPVACLSNNNLTTQRPDVSTSHLATTEPPIVTTSHTVTTEPTHVTTSHSNVTESTTHGSNVTMQESTTVHQTTSRNASTHHTDVSTHVSGLTSEAVTTAGHKTELTTGGGVTGTSTSGHITTTASDATNCRLCFSILLLVFAIKFILN